MGCTLHAVWMQAERRLGGLVPAMISGRTGSPFDWDKPRVRLRSSPRTVQSTGLINACSTDIRSVDIRRDATDVATGRSHRSLGPRRPDHRATYSSLTALVRNRMIWFSFLFFASRPTTAIYVFVIKIRIIVGSRVMVTTHRPLYHCKSALQLRVLSDSS